MSREILNKINQDQELTALRMEAEELINNAEAIDEDTFATRAASIKKQTEDRYTFLFEKYKNEYK